MPEKFIKVIIPALLLISMSIEVKAQITSGYTFGINISSMTIKINGVSCEAERPVGIHFGRMADISLSEIFGIRTGFLFSAKGTDYSADSLDYSLAPAYLEIPLDGTIKFGPRKVKFRVFTGPYLACAFGGYKLVPSGPMTNISFGKNPGDDLRRIDAGLNAGISACIRNFTFSLQYQTGLRDISPLPDPGSEMKNQLVGFSIMFNDR